MPGAGLLWIDCNEQQPAKRNEATAAARQHVMLDFIAKQHQTWAENNGIELQTTPDEEGEDTSSVVIRGTKKASRRHSNALKGKGSRRARDQPSNRPQRPAEEQEPPSSINPALVLAEDSQIYQAVWWHSLNLCGAAGKPTSTSWIDTCRSQWGQGFWEFAREDGTLREIFMSYAAAKEASVRSLADSKDYFVHKGRAMRLVSKDLQKEGKELRVAALATICLLAKATFIEEEYEAGEAHVRAIKAVVDGGRLFEVPSFLWLFIIWADLRLTGVSSRAPILPYGLHPDFEGLELPGEIKAKTRFDASCNMISLPQGKILSTDRVELLFRRLHGLALVYNTPEDIDWPPVWRLTYDTSWMLAKMRNEVESAQCSKEERETPYDAERILMLGVNIQMWSIVSQFVPQAGFLRYSLGELKKYLSHIDPKVLSKHWMASGGRLSSLLWVLFNASAAAIKLCFHGYLSSASMPHWLWRSLLHVCETLDITSSSEFEAAIKPFPFTTNWNGRMVKTVWLWAKTGFVLPAGEKRVKRAFFSNLRLTFDADADQQVRVEEPAIAMAAFETVLIGK